MRDADTPDLYELLGVPRDADDAAIRTGYRYAAKGAHPDAGGSQERFEAIKLARDVLLDPERRARYDRTGEAVPREADNAVARSLQVISQCLDAVLRDFNGQREVVHRDIVALVGSKISARANEARNQVSELRGGIEVNRWLLGRFRVTEDGPNLLENLVQGRIRQFEERIVVAEAQIAMFAEAQKLLASYSFTADPVVPSPMEGAQNPFFNMRFG